MWRGARAARGARDALSCARRGRFTRRGRGRFRRTAQGAPGLTGPPSATKELERQLGGGGRSRRADGRDGLGDFRVRQGTHVPDHALLAPERCGDAFARVVGPVLHGHGPVHHGGDAVAYPSCRFRLLVRDRGQDREGRRRS